MEGRGYTVSFDNVAVTAGQDLFELVPASNKPIAVFGLCVAQSSDVGDAAEEILRYSIIRGYTTSGNGGSFTPSKIDPSDGAASFTAEINGTTLASTGTPDTVHVDGFNVRSGLQLWLPPEAWWRCSAGETRMVCRILSTPADSLTMTGTVYVKEV